MSKKKEQIVIELGGDRRSLDRPAWTGSVETGGLKAFNHKHTRFGIIKNHFIRRMGLC